MVYYCFVGVNEQIVVNVVLGKGNDEPTFYRIRTDFGCVRRIMSEQRFIGKGVIE